MQVARNALALGHLCQVLNFFVGLAQPPVHPVALRKERVARADDHREKRRIEHFPTVDVQHQAFERAGGSHCEQTDDCGTLTLHAKRNHRRREDKESASAAIQG